MASPSTFPKNLIDDSGKTVQMVLTYIPLADVATFLREFAETVADDPTALEQMLIQWRHTAEVFADPELLAALTGPTDGDFGPLPEPPAVAT